MHYRGSLRTCKSIAEIEREHRRWHSDPAVNVASHPVAPIVIPPQCAEAQPEDSLPFNLKIALMSIAPFDSAGRAMHGKLKELHSDIPVPTVDDYRQLAALGFAVKHPEEHFHRITDNGRFAADHIAKALSKAHGIHAFYRGGNERYNSVDKCCCGWSASIPLGNQKMSMERLNARGRHIAHVEKTQAKVTNFLEGLLARQHHAR